MHESTRTSSGECGTGATSVGRGVAAVVVEDRPDASAERDLWIQQRIAPGSRTISMQRSRSEEWTDASGHLP